ncbi:MAG: AAA domain-containing protein [Spirochaetes bacterium]|jgi:MoxR-like ATPase|nr:AAA domain-containing protein [Spirochaetota bacterium]
MSELQSTQANPEIREASKMLARVRDEISRAVVGQAEMIDGLLMGILANGHVLLEGVPGLAKTLAVKTISAVIDSSFKRIQFTPDLLPADLVGNMVYRQQTGEFVPRKGPVFSNIVLADEINRAPAKVQSALLESMEERQVTIGDQTYGLPDPFFVLATQNPIEQEGTYPLPEAQLDRFLMKLTVNYPTAEEELSILRRIGIQQEVELKPVLFRPDIRRLKDIVSRVSVDERIEEYIVSLVTASRETSRGGHSFSRYIEFGGSPRATIYLYRCAKVKALFEGRDYVVPEDVKSISRPVLRHRIVLSYEAEAEELTTDDVVNYLLSAVPVP